jgi:hypothetical protein
VRHVSLSAPLAVPAGKAPAERTPAAEAAPAGRAADVVAVRGHLKRPRHGAGLAETKWIYVAGYEARRWVAPGPRKVVVRE